MNATCQSLSSQLVKVIDNFMDDYQEFREEAAEVFVETIIPENPAAEETLHNLRDQAMVLQLRLITAYAMVVGESKDKISTRHLLIPSRKITGTLTNQRTFILGPSPFDKVTVIFQKTGGKGGADIATCAKYANGRDFLKKMKFIEKGKEAQGDTVQFVFTDMAEKVLTMHLVQTGPVSHPCHFSLSIAGVFDPVGMENLYEVQTQKSWKP